MPKVKAMEQIAAIMDSKAPGARRVQLWVDIPAGKDQFERECQWVNRIQEVLAEDPILSLYEVDFAYEEYPGE